MRTILIMISMIAGVPATAQTSPADSNSDELPNLQQPPSLIDRAGHVANSSVGQVGQRQTREEVAPNIKPIERIASRIQNRVQSRIRNRIDRYYDPQANAASPFEAAGEQARKAGKPPRR